jgi:hypothetical protein
LGVLKYVVKYKWMMRSTALEEASAIDEILSELNHRGTRKSKGPKVDFMAEESSDEGGPFPQYGDCST